jgi:hypothetical protein
MSEKTKPTKKQNMIASIFTAAVIIAVIYFIFIKEPSPVELINMSDSQIELAYKDIKKNDSRARSVHIDKEKKRLIIARNITSKIGQDEQAKSWCTSFPEIENVWIVNLKNELLASAYCN